MKLPFRFPWGKRGITGDPTTAMAIEAISEPNPPRRMTRYEARVSDMTPEDRYKYGLDLPRSLTSYGKQFSNDYLVASTLTTMWTMAVNSRRDYYRVSPEIRGYDIADKILELICADVLNPDDNGDVVQFICDDPEKQASLDRLMEQIDFNDLLNDITYDLVDFGEYTLSMDVDPQGKLGVVGINDDQHQLGIVPLYDQGLPVQFLAFREGQYVMYPAHKFVHFVVGTNKMRIKVDDTVDPQYGFIRMDLPKKIRDKIPDYIRTGKPFFYTSIARIRMLQVLENLIPATKLNELTQSQIVTLNTTSIQDPQVVMEQCRDIEQMLNSQQGLDVEQDRLTLADIMSVVGRIKVLPNYSQDNIGGITRNDVRRDQTVEDILLAVSNIRNVLCSSLGIPPTFLFGPDSSSGNVTNYGHGTELRQYGRYARMIQNIQTAISRGLKQIAIAHLANAGFEEINRDEIDVIFLNDLADVSDIERMEIDDIKREFLDKNLDTLAKMQQNPLFGPALDASKIFEWMNEQINDLTHGIGLFNIQEDEDGQQHVILSDPAVQKAAFMGQVANNFIDAMAKRGVDVSPDAVAGETPDMGLKTDREIAIYKNVLPAANRFVKGVNRYGNQKRAMSEGYFYRRKRKSSE